MVSSSKVDYHFHLESLGLDCSLRLYDLITFLLFGVSLLSQIPFQKVFSTPKYSCNGIR